MKLHDHGFVELVAKTGHPGLMTINAARCSYGKGKEKFDDSDAKLVDYLLGHGHTSPFRHAIFTFHIKAPLFVLRQWHKYQVGSTWREYESTDNDPLAMPQRCGCYGTGRYADVSGETFVCICATNAFDILTDTDAGSSWNELSGRYKVLEPEFYVPSVVRSNDGKQSGNGSLPAHTVLEVQERMRHSNYKAMLEYNILLQTGVAKELARLVLPPSIYSECYWTCSLQAVLHFLAERLKPTAQQEIREYAQGVLELIGPSLREMGINLPHDA